MPIPDRTDPEMNEVWNRFHAYVNLTSDQLRNWLQYCHWLTRRHRLPLRTARERRRQQLLDL